MATHDLLNKTIVGDVGFTVTYAVNIKEPVPVSELKKYWDRYIEDAFEANLDGIKDLDAYIEVQ